MKDLEKLMACIRASVDQVTFRIDKKRIAQALK